MQVSWNSYPCSFKGRCFSLPFPKIFSMFGLLQFEYVMPGMCLFFGIYPIWCSPARISSICGLVLVINFRQFWGTITSNMFFWSILSFTPPGLPITHLIHHLKLPPNSWMCSSVFLFVFSFIFLFVFQFIKSLLTYVSSLILSSAMSSLLMSPWKACFI